MRHNWKVLTGSMIIAAGLAQAANPPWGGDDTGWLPPIGSAVNKCETNLGKQTAKLFDKIGKCHAKRIAAGLADDAAAQQCAAALLAKFAADVNTDGCDACTNPGTIGSTWSGVADAGVGSVLCGPGGTIPADRKAAKCAARVVKGVGKLHGALAKCHANRAKGKLGSIDAEESCEASAIAVFSRRTKTKGCETCIDLAAIATQTEAAVGGQNDLVYCQSPSSAFVETRRGLLSTLF